MKYIIVPVVFFFLLIFFYLLAYGEESILLSGFRQSLDKEKIRLVFDLTKEASYTVSRKGNPETFIIEISGAALKKDFKKEFKTEDNLLEKVLFSEKDGVVKIEIKLHYPLPSNKVEFFALQNPDRIVADFYRNFEEKTVTYISEGIVWTRIIQGNFSGRIIINIVEADLSPDNVYLKALQALDNNKSRERVTSMASRTGALVALNGGFYHAPGGPLGLVVIDGKIEASPVKTRPPRSVLGITDREEILIDRVDVKDNKLKSLSGEDWTGVVYAIGGGPNLITGGKLNMTDKEEELGPGGNDVTQRDSHTAIGITEDNKLVFFTVDGRKLSYSRGMTLKSIGEYMLTMGVVEALCMDGGNSTAMVIQDKLVTETFDKERKVANCWALFTGGIITAPASIEVLNKTYSELASGEGKYSLEIFIKDSQGKAVPDGTGVTFKASSGIIKPSFSVTKDGKVFIEFTSACKDSTRLVISSGVIEKEVFLDF